MFGELRYAVRRLRANPVFSIGTALTLALAIGATGAVFSVVDAVVLKPFPYRDGDRVLMLFEQTTGAPQFAVSPANYLDWRAQNRSFTMLAAASIGGVYYAVAGDAGAQRLVGLPVTANYFTVLGITPALGRPLAQDSSGSQEVLISYAYWRQRFAASPSVLGRTLSLSNRPYTIVGVMPPGLPEEALNVNVWTRLSFTEAEENVRWTRSLAVWGRLKPHVTLEAAEQDMRIIAQRLAQEYPKTNAGWSISLLSSTAVWVGDARSAFLMVLAAAACVLLIGTANLANLFLVRAVARERDMAMRTALGATRGRLVRQLFVEVATLGAISTALGICIAIVTVQGLRTLAPPWLPRVSSIGVDGPVVAFCVVLSIVSILLLGLLPSLEISGPRLAEVLKQGGAGTGSARRRRLQDSLVVLQIGTAFVLLTGAGLLGRSFEQLTHTNPGFQPNHVLTASVTLPAERYPTRERQASFITSAINELEAQPGVRSASASSFLPGAGGPHAIFTIRGNPPPDPSRRPAGHIIDVSPSYFRTMDIPMRQGRSVLPSDDDHSVKVAVIDETLANQFFAKANPLGNELVLHNGSDTVRIVGVVGAVRQDGLDVSPTPQIYTALAQSGDSVVALAVRTTGDPGEVVATLTRVIADLDRTVAVSDIQLLTAVLRLSISTTRFSSFLVSLFSVIALALGGIGIYSVLAYIVSQSQREIAVRIALGAGRARLVAAIARRAGALAGAGIVVGVVAALVVDRSLAALFVGVSPHDPLAFVGAATTFAVVTIAAATIPALRATRVDPRGVLSAN